MASDSHHIAYICEQMSGAGAIRSQKMFGEYAIYCDEKLVALVCDNQVFAKITEAGRALISAPVLAPPYPGAKPCFAIDEFLDDAEWLATFIHSTARELPLPKRKKS